MLDKIKNELNKKLAVTLLTASKKYDLKSISPLLDNGIKDFVLRPGKRIRPSLAIISYLGFTEKPLNDGIYSAALSLELLHDFLLVHDDIIDDSDLRRGLPSMHKIFDGYILQKSKRLKFGGKELAIIAGDCIYAIAVDAMLSAKIDPQIKEAALKKLLSTAVSTCGGEFAELILSAKKIRSVMESEIYTTYDLKTARYTFSTPLEIGAILARAGHAQIDRIALYGSYLGRAFQIRDDILDMFAKEEFAGKSPLGDIKESKKTVLLWHAHKTSSPKDKSAIENILSKKDPAKSDLQKIRQIVLKSGALYHAKDEILRLADKAKRIGLTLTMRPKYKEFLMDYSRKILDLKFADSILTRSGKYKA